MAYCMGSSLKFVWLNAKPPVVSDSTKWRNRCSLRKVPQKTTFLCFFLWYCNTWEFDELHEWCNRSSEIKRKTRQFWFRTPNRGAVLYLINYSNYVYYRHGTMQGRFICWKKSCWTIRPSTFFPTRSKIIKSKHLNVWVPLHLSWVEWRFFLFAWDFFCSCNSWNASMCSIRTRFVVSKCMIKHSTKKLYQERQIILSLKTVLVPGNPCDIVAKFSFLPTMSLSALKSPSAERCINKQNAGQGFQPIGKPSHTPLNVVPI